MVRILAHAALVGAIVVAVTCGGAAYRAPAPTPSAAPAPSIATATVAFNSVEFPVAPADQDEPVWAFVRQWEGANISPILHPGFLPPGFDTVTVGQSPNKQDPYLLSVNYSGPGKELHILAGGINPSEAFQDGYQQNTTVRGHDAVIELQSGVDPRGGISLWWTEPGAWVQQAGSQVLDHVLYALYAEGLTPQEVLQVAESLTPSGQ